jgi:hypothetical protein
VFGTGHADRQGQPDLIANSLAQRGCDLVRRSEQVDSAGYVEEGFIYRDPLNQWREVMEHRHDFVAKFLVSAKVTANEEEIAAELTGPPTRHARPDSEAPGLIGRRQHDATAHSDRTVSQRRIQQLLDRRIKGVQVRMKDRCPIS